jgi:hypothetical protein
MAMHQPINSQPYIHKNDISKEEKKSREQSLTWLQVPYLW